MRDDYTNRSYELLMGLAKTLWEDVGEVNLITYIIFAIIIIAIIWIPRLKPENRFVRWLRKYKHLEEE